jgi:Uma2 family endonuclease
MAGVRVVFLEAPQQLLAERRRLGLDGRDEMWEGELHMVPPPSFGHQEREAALAALLVPIARDLGLRVATKPGLYASDDSWRVPELVVARPEQVAHRGVEGGAVLVIEIRFPGDETDAKVPFYTAFGVEELLIVDRDTAAVTLRRHVDAELALVATDRDGWVTCSLGLAFRQAAGGVLEVRLPDGRVERC